MLTSGRKRAALVLVVAAMGVSACGPDEGDGTIPPGDARALTEELNDVEDALDRNACDTASALVANFKDEVDALGADVGTETKGTLFEMADNLSELIDSDCVEPDFGPSGASGPQGSPSSEDEDDG